jgi:hypothetical protein
MPKIHEYNSCNNNGLAKLIYEGYLSLALEHGLDEIGGTSLMNRDAIQMMRFDKDGNQTSDALVPSVQSALEFVRHVDLEFNPPVHGITWVFLRDGKEVMKLIIT